MGLVGFTLVDDRGRVMLLYLVRDSEAHRRIIDAALVGLDHLHDEADDGLGREVLPALFPLRQRELVEEVFVNVA